MGDGGRAVGQDDHTDLHEVAGLVCSDVHGHPIVLHDDAHGEGDGVQKIVSVVAALEGAWPINSPST
jgi:hypothetical protein